MQWRISIILKNCLFVESAHIQSSRIVPHGWFWLPGVDHVHDGTKEYGAYANMEKHFGNPDLAYVIPEISVDEFDDWLMNDTDRRVLLFGHRWLMTFQNH